MLLSFGIVAVLNAVGLEKHLAKASQEPRADGPDLSSAVPSVKI